MMWSEKYSGLDPGGDNTQRGPQFASLFSLDTF